LLHRFQELRSGIDFSNADCAIWNRPELDLVADLESERFDERPGNLTARLFPHLATRMATLPPPESIVRRRSLIGFLSIEPVIGWKRDPHRRQPFERRLAALVLDHSQTLPSSVDDLELVARLEAQLVDERLGQSDGEAIAPFGHAHDILD
jgi:hypothetical protein